MYLFATGVFFFSGEKLSDAELDEVVKDCMDPEDEDGMIPYVRKYSNFYHIILHVPKKKNVNRIHRFCSLQ